MVNKPDPAVRIIHLFSAEIHPTTSTKSGLRFRNMQKTRQHQNSGCKTLSAGGLKVFWAEQSLAQVTGCSCFSPCWVKGRIIPITWDRSHSSCRFPLLFLLFLSLFIVIFKGNLALCCCASNWAKREQELCVTELLDLNTLFKPQKTTKPCCFR